MAQIRPPTRQQLGSFLKSQELVRYFEQLFLAAGQDTPDEIIVLRRLVEEATVEAQSAFSAAIEALAALQALSDSLGLEPRAQLGTIASQNADAIEVGTVSANVNRAFRATNQTSSAAASAGTLANAPAAGDPTFWLKVNINSTNFAIPCWAG